MYFDKINLKLNKLVFRAKISKGTEPMIFCLSIAAAISDACVVGMMGTAGDAQAKYHRLCALRYFCSENKFV